MCTNAYVVYKLTVVSISANSLITLISYFCTHTSHLFCNLFHAN